MKALIALQDIDLIQQYIAGDQKSFEILLKKYQNKVFSSIFLIIKEKKEYASPSIF